MTDWFLLGVAGILVAAGLIFLAIIEFFAAAFNDGRTRFRIERAVYGCVYLGVAWYTVSGLGWAAVAVAVGLGVLGIMWIFR